MEYGRVVLLTGASSGIGKITSEKLADLGLRVYGTSRRANNGNIVYSNEASQGFVEMVQLDVCSDQSVKDAVSYVMEKEGCINVLINNAGFGLAGAIEETTAEEAMAQLNTNFFGTHRMCREVLPIMRKQKKGLIINIGSVAGIFSIPYQSMYSASKFALEAYTEALRIEVRDFGIKAVIVEPGDTRTSFTENRQYTAESENTVYPNSKKSIHKMIKDEKSGDNPIETAQAICKLLYKKNPPVRVTVGPVYKLFVQLKRVFPNRLTEYIIRRMYS
ncbi:MAG: SDR family oxidoreductase [Caldicoprobacterales bacterium]|nr:SDR family oxidoreductase [Clostridiales bacterium]